MDVWIFLTISLGLLSYEHVIESRQLSNSYASQNRWRSYQMKDDPRDEDEAGSLRLIPLLETDEDRFKQLPNVTENDNQPNYTESHHLPMSSKMDEFGGQTTDAIMQQQMSDKGEDGANDMAVVLIAGLIFVVGLVGIYLYMAKERDYRGYYSATGTVNHPDLPVKNWKKGGREAPLEKRIEDAVLIMDQRVQYLAENKLRSPPPQNETVETIWEYRGNQNAPQPS